MPLCNFVREALIYKGHYTRIGEWNAPKCLCACAHVNFEFLEIYFEFQPRSQKLKFSMSQLIFSIPPSWPYVWLDSLNSRSLGLYCGLHHAAPVGSGFNVSFWYIWTHTWWPVWRQTCNLPKPTEGQIGFGFNLVPTISVILFFCPYFLGFFTLSPLFMWL